MIATAIESKTESYQLNRELTFYQASGTPLTVQTLTLAITKQENALQQCRLTFQVNLELYHCIDQLALFNLKPEIREPLPNREFSPESDITIETEFQPDLLSQLSHGNSAQEIATYLIELNNWQDPHSPLLTENWFCLSVKQQQGQEEIGYRTLWGYANLSTIKQVVSAGSEILKYVANFLQESVDSLQQETNQVKSPSISEVMLKFFEDDDWDFVLNDGVLQVSYQGENGRWFAYGQAEDEAQQFIFYSVCPLNIPLEQISQMAEFLSKVNYGLIIGNFELDFRDGEIRYKTSIDVQDDRLCTALVKNLVYTNVLTIDKYLPSIAAIINQNLSPDEAIALIEG